MIEHPKELHSILKYDIFGKLAYIKEDGSPAYKIIMDRNQDTAYYIDDLVKNILGS